MDVWIEFTNSRYGYMMSLVPNFALLMYTSWKLLQDCTRGTARNDKLYGQHRFTVFLLMFISLLSKCLYDVKGLYIYYRRIAEDEIWMYIFSIIGQFRTVMIVNVATYFAKAWHRSYMLFEDSEESKRDHKIYSGMMFFLNLSMYVSLVLIPLHWYLEKFYFLSVMFGVFEICLVIVTIALATTGKNFYKRVLNLLSYTGRSVKSSQRFLKIYYLILICCIMKCLEMGMAVILSVSGLSLPSSLYYIYDIASLFVYRGLIEPVFFTCLIVLMNESASKCESVASAEISEHFIQNVSRCQNQSQSLEVY